MPNILIRLGEALGANGSLALLRLLSGGSVWVAMSIRRNKDDHGRLEAKHDRLEAKVDDLRKETREEFKALNSRLDRILERLPPLQ